MIYAIANGGFRTGSTLVYNIARILLVRHAGRTPVRLGLVSDPRVINQELRDGALRYACRKCHVWPDASTTKSGWPSHTRVLFTYRNPFDTALSLKRYRDTWEEVLIEIATQQVRAANLTRVATVRGHASLRINYDDYYDRLDALVQLVAAHLGVPAAPDCAAIVQRQVAKQIGARVAVGEQDFVTLLQHQHVGPHDGVPGAWRLELTDAEVADVRRVVQDSPDVVGV